VGNAFANALAPEPGSQHWLAVLTPNVAVKPARYAVTKVDDQGRTPGRCQMFGPAGAVAKRGPDSGSSRRDSQSEAENICDRVRGIHHWYSQDDKKDYDFNYEATKLAIQYAMEASRPEKVSPRGYVKHPFQEF